MTSKTPARAPRVGEPLDFSSFRSLTIPYWIVKRKDISAKGKLIAGYILERCTDGGGNPRDVTIAEISDFIGLGERQTHNELAKLRKIGLLQTERRGLHQPARRRIVISLEDR